MKRLKLLLLTLPLLFCGCGSNKNNSTSSVVITEPAWKQEFYDYVEKTYMVQTITIEFRLTEAHTFDYDYYVADIYYTVGTLYKIECLVVVNPSTDKIIQIGRVIQ